MNPATQQLNGWKEIACYMNRSVCCVQRWERNEDLPVRRHGHRRGVSVYAHRRELDAWWEREFVSSKEFGSEQANPFTKGEKEPVGGATRGEFALTTHEVTAVRFFLMLMTASTAQELHHSTVPEGLNIMSIG